MLRVAKSVSEDDFFRCQQYLFDYTQWRWDVLRANNLWGSKATAAQNIVLRAAEESLLTKLRYFESMGCAFEPVDFWVERGEVAHLVDRDEWVLYPWSDHAGYPRSSESLLEL